MVVALDRGGRAALDRKCREPGIRGLRRGVGPCIMHPMKLVASFAAILLAATGCEKPKSKLDAVTSKPMPGASAVGGGSLEARVAKLERYSEALDFLQKVYDQQQQQQAQQEDREPAPDAVFAVDITQSLANNHYEGPAQAAVTIIEAWDFA